MSEARKLPDWLPYVLPYVLFLVIGWAGTWIPGAEYPIYPIKTLVLAGVIFWFWRARAYPEWDLKPSLLGIGAGLLGFALWLLPEGLLSGLPKIGTVGYDPDSAGDWRTIVIVSQIAGAVLVVPIFEELFLRSFLMRYLDMVKDNGETFTKIPIGRYRLFSFIGVVTAMAITHHRWLRGGLYSALLCAVLYKKKRMGPVIWAHAITNGALAIYGLKTGNWAFW